MKCKRAMFFSLILLVTAIPTASKKNVKSEDESISTRTDQEFRGAKLDFINLSGIPSATVDQSPVKTLITAFRNALSSAKSFAESEQNKSDVEFITRAEEGELKDLNILENKKLSQFTLQAFSQDIKFLDEYRESGDSAYLKASVNDVREMIVANQTPRTKEKMVTITVVTVDNDGKSVSGYQICCAFSSWADLPNACRPFDKPSSWSKELPADRNFLFWSRVYGDESKVSPRTQGLTDTSKTITIGIPSSK